MITLGTGLPGNGKTLWMLWSLAQKAKKENREVYYHNVNLADVEPVNTWQKFDPLNWMDLPHGSLIVIDECQEIFPKKANGAQLPPHYEELAKHRHKGFDIFLITQHPTLIDNFVRKLVGQHYHSVRKFGMERATIYEWSATSPAPENASSQRNAIPHKWKYPKDVYTWYKSAEVHTVKRAIPMKLVLACLFVVGVVAFAFYWFNAYKHRYDKEVTPAKQVVWPAGANAVVPVVPVGSVPSPKGAAAGASIDPVQDAKDYVFQQTPRVAGVPSTAPKYDPLTKPTRVPMPDMCISKQSYDGRSVTCKCYTNQATPIDVPYNMCIEISRNGYFHEFDSDREREQLARTEASQKALQRVPEAALPDHGQFGAAAVVVMPGAPMGPARTERSAPLNGSNEIQDGPPNNRATRAAAGNTVAGL